MGMVQTVKYVLLIVKLYHAIKIPEIVLMGNVLLDLLDLTVHKVYMFI